MIIRGSIYGWYSVPFLLAIAIVTFAARYWRFFVQWVRGIRGQDWAAVSAAIDVVTVAVQTEQRRYGERIVGYLATLSYFYRNPELQMESTAACSTEKETLRSGRRPTRAAPSWFT
jgi:hypothetical protein